MSLTPGTRIGVYEVTGLLGAGGMGEVYRARDTKLDRDVALKVLPEAFTADPDRLARFEREAKVLASLNHPNIGSIYGLEEADGVRALVLRARGPATPAVSRRGHVGARQEARRGRAGQPVDTTSRGRRVRGCPGAHLVPEALAEAVDARLAAMRKRMLRTSDGRLLGRPPGRSTRRPSGASCSATSRTGSACSGGTSSRASRCSGGWSRGGCGSSHGATTTCSGGPGRCGRCSERT